MARPAAAPRALATKVPEITALFWVVKVLTTGMGEAASDYLGEASLVVGGLVGVGGFVVALRLQLRSDRYRAPVYWFCVSMIAVFGTMVADVARVATGLPLWATSALCAVAVAVLFGWWWRTEGTLDVHSITTARRERFYWATVLATFALGTAVGDLTGLAMGLGFLPSGVLFAAAMLVPLLAWRAGVNPVLTFWAAYVLTRPLGASFADWLSKPHALGGGLGYGDGPVTLLALAVIVVLVAHLTRGGHDVRHAVVGEPPPAPAASPTAHTTRAGLAGPTS